MFRPEDVCVLGRRNNTFIIIAIIRKRNIIYSYLSIRTFIPIRFSSTCSAKSFNYDRVVHRKVHLRVGTDERQYNAPAFASGERTGDAATRLAAHGFCAARILSHGFLRFQHHFRRPSRRQTKLCTARTQASERYDHRVIIPEIIIFRFSARRTHAHSYTHTDAFVHEDRPQ